MALTVVKIRSIKPAEKAFKVADEQSLYLHISPTGTKAWRWSYRHAGKAKTLSMGVFPGIGLADARILLANAKRQVASGVDPSMAKRIAARSDGDLPASDSFEAVFRRWFERKLLHWEPKNAAALERRFKGDVLPAIGGRAINTITPQDVLDIVRTIEGRGSINMARRMRGAMGEVFRFGVAEGMTDRDPSRDIDAALAPKPKAQRRRALSPERVPAFMTALDAYAGEPVISLALVFQIHTAARPVEATSAEWVEFADLDGEEPLWRIPAERMKGRREHLVPLSRQALFIVKEMRRFSTGSPYVFEDPSGVRAISSNAMLRRVQQMDFAENPTAHGFRSSASTWMNEQGFNRDAIELCLAHVDSSVRGIYNRAPYLAERREMLQAWSDFIKPI